MATIVAKDKYFLKSLHEQIGLFDRKLAHLQKYETFASDKDRDAAAAKMNTKRATLVRTAQSLVEEGVEFKPSDLPRSMRPEDEHVLPETAGPDQSASQFKAATDPAAQPASDGTQLDYRTEIMDYLRNRKKTGADQPAVESIA